MICWAFKKPEILVNTTLRHRGANSRQYNFVVDKVMHKLSGWKSKFLSFAGRAVLIKFVMSAIPNTLCKGWLSLLIFAINWMK